LYRHPLLFDKFFKKLGPLSLKKILPQWGQYNAFLSTSSPHSTHFNIDS
jgi:hypothetical protein